MIWLTVTSILCVFTWMQWRRYSHFNQRQLIICQKALQTLLASARSAGEPNENIEILLNAAIDTYNENLRGPWFYTRTWKIPRHTFMVKKKKNETERHTKGRHSDSESEVAERQE